MNRISIFAIIIACLFSGGVLKVQAQEPKTKIIADNTLLLSDEAKATDNILKEIKFDKSAVYIHFQVQNAGQIHCEDSKTVVSITTTLSQDGKIPMHGNEPHTEIATTCNFIPGSIEDKKEKLYGAGTIYRLKDGKTILSISGNTTNLGDLVYEVEYDDLATLSSKRSIIVSKKAEFAAGITLENQTVHFVNHTGTLGAKTYNTASINSYSLMEEEVNPKEGGLIRVSVYSKARFNLAP